MKKIILIYSGGLDSTVLLYDLVAAGHKVRALSIDYGQKHKKELESASYHTNSLNVPHKVINLTSATSLFGDNALTGATTKIPDASYEEENMKTTVVPNRNMIFMSFAAAWAMSLKFDYIAYAAHAGDHTIYPDCREEFAESIEKTISLADWHSVSLLRPYVSLTKGEICAKGSNLAVPFEKTWSCYKGRDIHCGVCGTCRERKEAFIKAKVTDPTKYTYPS